MAGPPDVEQLGDAVLLRRPIVAEVRRLLTAAAREAVRRDGIRPSQRLLHLLAVLDAACNVPRDVPAVTAVPAPVSIDAMTTTEAAETLGICNRQTRRLADRLGAVRTTHGLRYDAELVRADRRRRLRTGAQTDTSTLERIEL